MENKIIISLDEYNNMKAEIEKLREVDLNRTISVSLIMQGKTYYLQATPEEAKDTNGFHILRNKIEYHLKDIIREKEIYQNRLAEQERETLDAVDSIGKLCKYINNSYNELYELKNELYELKKKNMNAY